MLQNAYLLAKIGADTAENERNFAKNLPKFGNYPTGRAPRRGKASANPGAPAFATLGSGEGDRGPVAPWSGLV